MSNLLSSNRVATAVASLLLVATTAFAKDPPAAATAQPLAEMQMQISTEGMTHGEYLARQEQLNAALTAEMPIAAFAAPLRVSLTQEQLDAIAQAPPTPLRIGAVTELEPRVDIVGLSSSKVQNAATQGVLSPAADGGYVWALAINSADAGSIRVHIENLDLPAGVSLYFYSLEGEAFGPWTGKGPDGTGDIWTESVFGQEGVLQLRISGPANEALLKQISFSVTEVGNVLPEFAGGMMLDGAPRGGFCGNVPCIVDVSCSSGGNSIRDAYAKMEWIAGAFIYTCTGGLLNDNNPSQNNFFLTANHCLSKNNIARNVQFYWRFRTSSCNGSCPSNSGWPYKTTGSTLKTTGKTADFTLLQLNSNPPSGSVFLGWTTTAVANSNGVALHRVSNPNFGPQVYSTHTVDTSAPTCQGWARGPRIYSRDTFGATDGGSSGSPVVNSADQVVGQLSGACGFNPGDPCDSSSNATVDGAFASYYSSVQPHLNP
ncbi:MAG TPA: trypsin-like peptidase domain-containing protein [Phycisphaerae bacterium]|nr:trypsin-like peptidase domain-containing protein [Phycisphaerae bacterium]